MLQRFLRLEQLHARAVHLDKEAALAQLEDGALEEVQPRGGGFSAQVAGLGALWVAEADVVCLKVAVA